MSETTTPEVPVVQIVHEKAQSRWRRFVPSKTNVALATAVIVLFVVNTKQAQTIIDTTPDEDTTEVSVEA